MQRTGLARFQVRCVVAMQPGYLQCNQGVDCSGEVPAAPLQCRRFPAMQSPSAFSTLTNGLCLGARDASCNGNAAMQLKKPVQGFVFGRGGCKLQLKCCNATEDRRPTAFSVSNKPFIMVLACHIHPARTPACTHGSSVP